MVWPTPQGFFEQSAAYGRKALSPERLPPRSSG
jgi:hypothetical protein